MRKFTTLKSSKDDDTEVYLKLEIDMFLQHLDRKITNLCINFNALENGLTRNDSIDTYRQFIKEIKKDLIELYFFKDTML